MPAAPGMLQLSGHVGTIRGAGGVGGRAVKLASLRRGGRDGTLIVVDRALRSATAVARIAPTLQHAVERWDELRPQLQDVYERLNAGGVDTSFAFKEAELAAPLPRAYQWLDGSAYVNHVELVRRARGAQMPERFWTDPLMYQGGSDGFDGPRDPIRGLDPAWGIDFEAEVAVVTDDVPLGCSTDAAAAHIVLLMLVNDVSLRALIPGELEKGFGFVHGKPRSAFSPVAVTPDELGDAWHGGKLHLPLRTEFNDQPFGQPDAGQDMTFGFPRLLSHAATTRSLAAGSIVGSGTVSNVDRSRGSSCLAERRMLEKLDGGAPSTPFMQPGDRVRIEMLDDAGRSIFGAIDQRVE